jgi:hypothetical protein
VSGVGRRAPADGNRRLCPGRTPGPAWHLRSHHESCGVRKQDAVTDVELIACGADAVPTGVSGRLVAVRR